MTRLHIQGPKTSNDDVIHAWERLETRTGVQYVINREHPLVKALEAITDDHNQQVVHRLLKTVETTFPFDAVYADMASERRPSVDSHANKYEELFALVTTMLDALGSDSEYARKVIMSLSLIEPFSSYPEYTNSIQRKLLDADR